MITRILCCVIENIFDLVHFFVLFSFLSIYPQQYAYEFENGGGGGGVVVVSKFYNFEEKFFYEDNAKKMLIVMIL